MTSGNWTAVPPRYIPINLYETPLEIKTNSTLGSGDDVLVLFYTTQGSTAIGIWIDFATNPRYEIYWCKDTWINFANNLPTEVDKI